MLGAMRIKSDCSYANSGKVFSISSKSENPNRINADSMFATTIQRDIDSTFALGLRVFLGFVTLALLQKDLQHVHPQIINSCDAFFLFTGP